MFRYVFIMADTLPLIAFANTKDEMRAYARQFFGMRVLPRHCCTRIA